MFAKVCPKSDPIAIPLCCESIWEVKVLFTSKGVMKVSFDAISLIWSTKVNESFKV